MTNRVRPVACVTGASRGLGRRIAETLAPTHDLALGFHRTAIDGFPEALRFGGDIADPATSRRAVDSIRERFGRLDLFVPNAGFVADRRFGEITDDEWDRHLRVNLDGVFHGLRAFGPLLESSSGTAIVVSSLLARRGATGAAAYAAAKAAVIGLALSAAREWAPRVRVNIVLPGYLETDMGLASPRALDRAREEHLLKRTGSIEDAARLVAFVATLSGVTGQVFSADGRLARW